MAIYKTLIDDHRTMQIWIGNMEQVPPEDISTRAVFIDHLLEMFRVHHLVEELAFYLPLKAFSAGIDIYGRHQTHTQLIQDLEDLRLPEVCWHEAAPRFRQLVDAHFDEEESALYDLCADRITAEESAQFAEVYISMKSILLSNATGTRRKDHGNIRRIEERS